MNEKHTFVHFLLVILFSVVTCIVYWPVRCPSRCTCVPDAIEDELLEVTCKWSRTASKAQPLANFPRNITKILSLECDSDFSSELSDDLFAGFSNLQILKIQNCAVAILPSHLFRGLSALRSLYLYQMALNDLPLTIAENLFDDLRRLEKLSIIDSHVYSFPEGSLCTVPNLQVLNMSHNWLTSANIGFTPNCSSNQVIIVDFSHNRISAIRSSDLNAFPIVHHLSVSNNQISEVDDDAFHLNTVLQNFDASNNQIDKVPNLPDAVIHLNLANNRLSVIQPSIASLPDLIWLSLRDNLIDSKSMSSFASEKIEFIDFSDNHFESLPLSFLARSSQTLSQLHLSNNWISNIQALNFTSFTALRTLDLSSNRLSELFDECFEGLADLSNLKLSNNSIYQVGITVFDSVPQLTGLDLSHNALVEVPIALGRLFKLRHLNISRNQISKTYKFLFNKLPHLRILDLSHNNLPTIDSYVFSDLPRLTDLFLSHNSIGSIVREGFVKCPRLQMIDLSNNFLSSLNGAFNGVYSLKRLILSYNTMEVLQWTELPATLSTLLIDHNRITLLGSAVKSQVTHAELQHNHLMVLSADQIPETMENLNVSCNAIHTIINHTFAKKSGLKSLDLTFNSLSILKLSSIIVHSPINPVPTRLYVQGNPLICTCEMEWMMRSNTTLGTNFDIIDLALTNCKNRIDNGNMVMAHISTADLLCVYNLACEPECICCQYGNCDCKSKCPDGCQCYHDATYMTNIVRCSSLVGHDRKNFSPKDLPMYATHVYLEGMNIPVIRSHDFLGRIRLVHLHINDSGVREIQPLAFNTLSSLKLLDLSGNKLDRLLGDEMFRTEKVTHLFLNDNRLTLLNTRVTEVMPSLQVVALHNNLLTELPTAIEQLTPSLVQVSLSSNPYRCDCSNRFRMQYWLPQHVDRVVDAERIFCVENVTKAFQGNDTTVLSAYPPNHGKHLFIMPMAEFIAEFNSTLCVAVASGVFGTKTAANSALMTAMLIAIFLVGVALILLGITMLRRVQATIAQRRYKAPPSLNCSHPTQGSSPMPLIHFDAFVSYSNMDEKLVIDFLCRQLEAQDYLLCLLHRDGPAYNTRLHSISDELIKQMECSQSLIIVVTNNFLENEWKTLQIKTSHQLFAKNRYKKLIAVLSDDIEPNRFDTELGQILRKNTCIRMNDPLFWNLLHSALPVRMSPSTYSGDSMQIYSDCYGGIVPSDVI